MQSNNNHGGKRLNSGRFLLYGEPTDQVQFICPKSKKTEFKTIVKKILEQWKIERK